MSISCEQCQAHLILFIDNEIEDSATFNEIAFHLQECPNCQNRFEVERRTINLMRALLTRSCCETAPQALHDRVAHRLHQLELAQMAGFTEIITQYRRTEITIDGETQIEIETSREIRRDFPLD
jgi:mycothiol system anti-sigma-R factor